MKTCQYCGMKFKRPKRLGFCFWGRRRWCSRYCWRKYYKSNDGAMKGYKHSKAFKKKCSERMKRLPPEKHPQWRGGVVVTTQGYKAIRIAKRKYIGEHRLIIEANIHRKLKSFECVHHIDGDKKNNAIGNLVVLTRSGHAKVHGFGRFIPLV